MKIGIPRSLYYYYFKDLWKSFFESLGFEIVISPETTKEIMDLGLKYSNDEMCISMKNYIGHIAYLKDKCDYVLIPRIDNFGLDNQTCTNFLATYDIINNLFDIKILNYNINLANKETELKGLIKMMKCFNISKSKIKCAYNNALKVSEKIKNKLIEKNIKVLNSNGKKILLLGHSYNIHDNMISGILITILENLNIKIVYSDLFNNDNISQDYCEQLYWKYSRESISSINKCRQKIDGIIFLTSFPCGLDSLVNEIVYRKIDLPYINIVVDDMSSSVGLETRIESFIDIISVK